jgi:hypothetical protein
VPDLFAVKLSVPVCMPAEVGFPRNHSAEPLKAAAADSIGIGEDAEPVTMMTSPCAALESAFTTSMLIRAPDCTAMVGFTIPATRNVPVGLPEGLASKTRWSEVPEKVIRSSEWSAVAPVGTSLPSRIASVELTRGPGALAKRWPLGDREGLEMGREDSPDGRDLLP